MNRLEEITLKHKRIQKLLDETGYEAVLLKTQANFSWFTAGGQNLVTIADAEGVASLLITKDARTAVTNNIEIQRIMEEEDLRNMDFIGLSYDWYQGNELTEISKLVDPSKVLTDVRGLPYRYYGDSIQTLRYQLTEPEIERYLKLGELTSKGIEEVMKEVKPGMKESEVTGALLEHLWADRIDTVCVQAGADERAFLYRHPIPTEKKIGKLLVLNTNARKWGLVTTITRTLCFGKPDEQFEKQYTDNVYIETEMIEASKPGVQVQDIFHLTCGLYKSYGYADEWKLHHQGGAQGYKNRDYLMTQDTEDTVLANQCFCWNPSIAGSKSEDAFIARPDGPLMITRAYDMPVIKVQMGEKVIERPGLLVL